MKRDMEHKRSNSLKNSNSIEAAATGCGFACGFGWLWFSGLQEFFLPQFLWGNFWSGGGTSLFMSVLLIGFFSTYVTLRLQKKQGPGELPSETKLRKTRYGVVNAVHGLSLLLFTTGFLTQSSESHGFSAFIPALCSAFAALGLGLFWFSALLKLPSFKLLFAFCSASFTALVLNLICQLLPAFLSFIPCILMAAAWILALVLEKRKIRQNREILSEEKKREKRPRGRPPKKAFEKSDGREKNFQKIFWRNFAAFPILVFFVLCLEISVPGEKDVWHALSPFASLVESIFHFLGAIAGAWVFTRFHGKNPAKRFPPDGLPVFFILILSTQSAILLVLPSLCPALAPFFEGMFFIVILSLLAESSTDQAYEKAALVLGTILFLGNLADGAGFFLKEQILSGAWISPTTIVGLIGLILSGVLFLIVLRRKNIFDIEKDSRLASPSADLTFREQELAALVAENRTNREISRKLNISEATVRFHIRNIYQKTGLSKREELCEWVRRKDGKGSAECVVRGAEGQNRLARRREDAKE